MCFVWLPVFNIISCLPQGFVVIGSSDAFGLDSDLILGDRRWGFKELDKPYVPKKPKFEISFGDHAESFLENHKNDSTTGDILGKIQDYKTPNDECQGTRLRSDGFRLLAPSLFFLFFHFPMAASENRDLLRKRWTDK